MIATVASANRRGLLVAMVISACLLAVVVLCGFVYVLARHDAQCVAITAMTGSPTTGVTQVSVNLYDLRWSRQDFIRLRFSAEVVHDGLAGGWEVVWTARPWRGTAVGEIAEGFSWDGP